MCKPEVVGSALEREKEGNRDRGEIETARDIKRKTETNGYTERQRVRQNESEREKGVGGKYQRNRGRIREEEKER